MMPLFWIAHTVDKKPSIFIVEAEGGEIAILKASIAGFSGPHSEIHELDAKTARKIPKKVIGRVLDQFEANALLKKIGK
jgi:hypothetical protein